MKTLYRLLILIICVVLSGLFVFNNTGFITGYKPYFVALHALSNISIFYVMKVYGKNYVVSIANNNYSIRYHIAIIAFLSYIFLLYGIKYTSLFITNTVAPEYNFIVVAYAEVLIPIMMTILTVAVIVNYILDSKRVALLGSFAYYEFFGLAEKYTKFGVWKWNIKTGDIYWSNGMYKIYGCDSHGDLSDIVHQDDIDEYLDYRRRIMAGETDIVHEYRIVNANGYKWLRVSCFVNGDVAYGLVDDITATRYAQMDKEKIIQFTKSLMAENDHKNAVENFKNTIKNNTDGKGT